MSLSKTCRNLALYHEEPTFLKAECHSPKKGTYVRDVLDLDRVLGNDNGRLQWGNEGFAEDAFDLRLEGTRLYAKLPDRNGEIIENSVDLEDYIVNRGGSLGLRRMSH
jgi:hypothetical protein